MIGCQVLNVWQPIPFVLRVLEHFSLFLYLNYSPILPLKTFFGAVNYNRSSQSLWSSPLHPFVWHPFLVSSSFYWSSIAVWWTAFSYFRIGLKRPRVRCLVV